MKHSFFRMDEQVLYTMGTVCLIALIIMAFKTAISKTCDPITIKYSKDSVFVNEPVEIKATAKGKTFAWSLGDKLAVKETGATVLKTYTKASTYFIKVIVDGECDHVQMLTVYDKEDIDLNEGFATKGPDVSYPSEAYVNESVQFNDASPSSESWEWYFEKNRQPHGIGRAVNYTFKTTGTQYIRLIVNKKRDQVVTYQINVIKRPVESVTSNSNVDASTGGSGGAPRPRRQPRIINDAPSADVEEEKEEEKAVVPVPEVVKPRVVRGEDLNNAQLKLYLSEVNKGIKSAKDFAKYFCDKDIQINYEGKTMSFSQFCAELRRMKRVKDIEPIIRFSDKNNCVVTFDVTIKKRVLSLGRD